MRLHASPVPLSKSLLGLSHYDLFPVTIDLVISATTIYDRDSVFERVITQLAVADPSR